MKKIYIQQVEKNLNTIKYPCWKEILNRMDDIAVAVVIKLIS